ncbi:MAG: excinuclease ABC subunit UvrC [Candidatus Aceula lacicola]|nr:excinuclease ABC subunit UvrC [Candidatus Aceula lacicola]
MDIKKKIEQIPLSSGVYLMKSKRGKIIYVGKAVCLRKRVQSYFRKASQSSPKTASLVLEIKDIDYIVTSSEAEALILEASLIKKYKPKYNVDLKDDKSYPLIQMTEEDFSRVSIVRPRSKKGGAKTARMFGPYVNAKLIREALGVIRRIFHFRTCMSFPKKACLDYHIGLCDAPCIKNITKKEYRKIIRNVSLVLEGKKESLYRFLREEMERASKKKEFEKAGKIRDQIRAIGALYSGTKDVNCFKEAEQLQRVLKLPRRPERIEAFDISNTMGQQSVGSMVSFLNGMPDKKNYRRFRIRETQGIDDFKMIGEVVQRRYQRLKKEGALFPDLILVDGGKGQLSAAKKKLEGMDLGIPVVSIAKRNEEIFMPYKRNPVILSKDALGLKLIQRIRDEAHRFAINYHRLLRSRKVFDAK